MLLEAGTPGFEVTGTYHTMGGENLHEIQFDDCELPLENLVIREDGFRKLLTAFNTQRCLNPSISLGLAEGAFDEAVNYVRERTVFGKPIADHQGVRWKLADMFKDIEAGRGLLYRACMTANPFPDPFMAATAKVFCNEMSLRVTSEAVQLHGGFGFTDEYPVSRLYRGARYGSHRRRRVGDAARPDRQEDRRRHGLRPGYPRPRIPTDVLLIEADGKALFAELRHSRCPQGASGCRRSRRRPAGHRSLDGQSAGARRRPRQGRRHPPLRHAAKTSPPPPHAMLGTRLKGHHVDACLVEQAARGEERYLALMVDRRELRCAGDLPRRRAASRSSRPDPSPAASARRRSSAIGDAVARTGGRRTGTDRARRWPTTGRKLAKLLIERELMLAEINPLFVSAAGVHRRRCQGGRRSERRRPPAARSRN